MKTIQIQNNNNNKYLNKYLYSSLNFDFMFYYLLTLNVMFYKINKKIPHSTLTLIKKLK